MLSKTVFTVDGAIGNRAKVVVIGVTDSTVAGTLRTALANLSDGGFVGQSFSQRTAIDIAPQPGSNSDKRAICYFQDSGSGSVKRVSIPAPKTTMIEAVPGREGGERVTAAAMETIKSALEAATGDTLISLYGVIVQKR